MNSCNTQVRDAMTADPIAISPKAKLREVEALLLVDPAANRSFPATCAARPA